MGPTTHLRRKAVSFATQHGTHYPSAEESCELRYSAWDPTAHLWRKAVSFATQHGTLLPYFFDFVEAGAEDDGANKD